MNADRTRIERMNAEGFSDSIFELEYVATVVYIRQGARINRAPCLVMGKTDAYGVVVLSGGATEGKSSLMGTVRGYDFNAYTGMERAADTDSRFSEQTWCQSLSFA